MRDYHTLADLRVSTLSIECEPLRAARPLQRCQADGTVRRRQAARASSYPRQLPEGEVDRCKVRYGEDSRASTPGTLRE